MGFVAIYYIKNICDVGCKNNSEKVSVFFKNFTMLKNYPFYILKHFYTF